MLCPGRGRLSDVPAVVVCSTGGVIYISIDHLLVRMYYDQYRYVV